MGGHPLLGGEKPWERGWCELSLINFKSMQNKKIKNKIHVAVSLPEVKLAKLNKQKI